MVTKVVTNFFVASYFDANTVTLVIYRDQVLYWVLISQKLEILIKFT